MHVIALAPEEVVFRGFVVKIDELFMDCVRHNTGGLWLKKGYLFSSWILKLLYCFFGRWIISIIKKLRNRSRPRMSVKDPIFKESSSMVSWAEDKGSLM